MSISMTEIARQAGTSRTTVSFVLGGQWKERRIKEETYRRVLEVAREQGYRPNFIAQSLVSRKTRLIGVQFPSFLYEHWSSILKQLEIEARAREHRLLLSMPATYQDEQGQIEMLLDHQVDGLILAPLRARRLQKLWSSLEAQAKPCVFLGNSPGKKYWSVVDDNVGQAMLAVEHLIGLGHRQIALLVGGPENRSAIERYSGYRTSLANAKIPFEKSYVRVGASTEGWARGETQRLLGLPQPPTAIYCLADIMAIGAIQAVEDAGLKVPKDMAVVGHADDLPFKSFQRIPLTTVRQPREALAQQAMAMLFQIMQGQDPEEKYVQIPGELVVRQSCGHSVVERG